MWQQHYLRQSYYSTLSLLKRRIVGLDHIAIAVKDAKQHVAFFRDVLCLPVSERLAQADHGVYTTFVDLGNTKVELLEPYTANGTTSPITKFLIKNPQGGIHHICYKVTDLDEMVKQLSAKGIIPIGPVKIGAHGNPVVFLHPKDCQGTLIELEQVPK